MGLYRKIEPYVHTVCESKEHVFKASASWVKMFPILLFQIPKQADKNLFTLFASSIKLSNRGIIICAKEDKN